MVQTNLKSWARDTGVTSFSTGLTSVVVDSSEAEAFSESSGCVLAALLRPKKPLGLAASLTMVAFSSALLGLDMIERVNLDRPFAELWGMVLNEWKGNDEHFTRGPVHISLPWRKPAPSVNCLTRTPI